MCGRMNISDHEGVQWLLNELGLILPEDKFTPKYNIAPTSAVWGLAISRTALSLEPMQWGYIPSWAKEGQFKRPLFNARAESIWEKPSFRNLIRRYRGVIPANGFYEWRRKGKERVAHYISLKDKPAMALGAIMQVHADGYRQCCLITTESNAEMQSIHHRQPVIIDPGSMESWLTNDKPDEINRQLTPLADGNFEIRQVSDYVNNARNEGPECLQ
ncbi:hypothetical protein AB833_16815 [Chromatiales bacterium (ex Bugula neritina AB1)]|nr:hypothetical protein AB833_16815 [Chromatiales bacterium (ex Bugula neritina AB1)]